MLCFMYYVGVQPDALFVEEETDNIAFKKTSLVFRTFSEAVILSTLSLWSGFCRDHADRLFQKHCVGYKWKRLLRGKF